MQVDVRRLQPGDEQVALQIVRQLMPAAERDGREPSIEHLRDLLARETNILIMAATAGMPVGFLTAYRMPTLCCDASMVYLFEIEVAPPFRRQGIAKQMVNLLRTLCEDSDVEDIWVGTGNDNIAARRLYESTDAVRAYSNQSEYMYQLKEE